MRRFVVVVAAACAPFGCMAVVDFDGYHRTSGFGDGAPGDVVFVQVDAPPPLHEPTSLTFRDEDPAVFAVAGNVTIGRASDESDVTGYSLWWANGDAKVDHVTTVPVPVDPTAPLTYALPPGSRRPDGAARLLVVTVRGDIEMATGPGVDDADNFARVSAVAGAPPGSGPSSSQCSGDGCYPVAIVDPKTSKLLVVTRDGSYTQARTALFRCDLDATSCARQDLTDEVATEAAARVAVDTKSGKLLVSMSVLAGGGDWGVYRCDVGAASCAFSRQSAPAGGDPAVLYDAANDRTLVVLNGQLGSNPTVATCTADMTQCTPHVIDATNPISGTNAVIDAKNQKLLVATYEIQHGVGPDKGAIDFWMCDLDGTNCSYRLLSVGTAGLSALVFSLSVDTISDRLVFVTDRFVMRCDLTGNNCATTPSFGSFVGTATSPAWAQGLVDTAHRKLFLPFTTSEATPTLHLARCELDGTQCQTFDLATAPGGGPKNPSATLDPGSDRILVAWQNGSDDRPFVTWLRTW